MKKLLLIFIILNLCACSKKTIEDESVIVLKEYEDKPYVILNNNDPRFNEDNLNSALTSFEYYYDLDELHRPVEALASISEDIMPSEKRGDISEVKPTGWKQVINEDYIDGGSLYTRTHLIAHMFTGEDANWQNLITGTRFMNEKIMLPFEKMIKNYLDESDNHILYRVSPIFSGDELVARGVTLEAMSVEDKGDSFKLFVYLYNVQPCFEIDYANGESALDKTCEYTQGNNFDLDFDDAPYIANVNSMKMHKNNCVHANEISESNKLPFYEDLRMAKTMGFDFCKECIK